MTVLPKEILQALRGLTRLMRNFLLDRVEFEKCKQRNREDFENMIVEVAQAEYTNGSSWLQSAGCLGMFRDHNFIE